MINDIEKLYKDILTLPDDARAKMAASLIDSLDHVRDSDAEHQWEAEIRRRLLELDNNSVTPVSWLEARKLILKDSD